MTRKFTFLIMALLALMAIPGWGQTRETVTLSYGWENSDDATLWDITESIAKTENQGNTGSFAGKISTNNTYVQFKNKVKVTSFSFAFKRTSNNSNYNVYIETSTNGTDWTAAETYAMSSFPNGSYSTKTKTFDGTTEYFVRFRCNNTTAIRYVDDVTIEYSTGGTTTPVINAESSVSLAYNATEGQFDYSISNPATGVNMTASTEDSWISNITVNTSKVTFTTTENETSAQRVGTITLSYTGATSKAVTVTQAAAPAQGENYTLFSGDLVEGDYIIVFNNGAMGNEVSSNRLSIVDVTPVENVISTDNNDIVWQIAQNSDGYWTLYNAEAGKYAASTGTKNQITLSEDATDNKSQWTSTGNDSYEFINKNNAASNVNANLRRNGTFGFACYGTGTGGALTLYKKDGGTPSTVATPTFTPAAGTYTEAQNVTIACTTEGAAIYYTLDGSTPTNASTLYTSAIAVNETTTIKAIAYLNDEVSSVASATYTINIIVPLTSMDAIFAKANEVGGTATDVTVTFGNWVVSGVKGSNAYLTDGTKGLIIYASGHGFEVGDILSGTAACKVQLYRGAAELTTLTSSTDGLTVTEGGSVTAQEFNIADLSGINTGAIITVNNVTYSGSDNIFTDDDENEIKAYNTFMTLPSFTSGRQYNITGAYIQYNGTKEIAPRTEDDIYLIPGTEYAINLLQNDYGTISADLETASAGQTVTLSATPIEHYHLTSWTVLDDEANEIAVSNNQFTMPASDVEIEASFEEDELYVFTYYYNGEYYTDYLAYGGTLITLEEDPDMSPVGFSFAGWSTSVASTDVIEGTTYTLNSDVNFYAVFEKQETSKGSNSFEKVTEAPANWSGEYLLVYEGGESNGNPVPAVAWTGVDDGGCGAEVTITSNTIAEKPETAVTLTIAPMEGGYSIRVNGGENDGKYIGRSANSNGLNFTSEAQLNTLAITDGEAVITAAGNCTMRYNYASGANSLRFRYYASGQQAVQLYKKSGGEAPVITGLYTRVYDDVYDFEGEDLTVEGPSIVVNGYTLNVTGEMVNTTAANLVIEDGAQLIHKSENVAATVQMNINGYGNSAGGYYLVATPIADDVDPNNVANMLDGEYDLYRFDESEELEWRNYKAESFNMNSMNGYLYANHDNTVLSMAGILNSTSEILTSTYSYTEESEYAGHNIVGNPFACNAELDRPFYTLNEDGSEFLATEGTELKPCQGALVVVESADDEVYFDQATSTRGKSISNITIEVSSDNVLFDRAIISNSGRTLEKFMLDPSNTKLYIPQNGNEYAVVSADAKVCEMPVNFKAAQNGTYTLSFNLRNMDLDYLHMIDNMTGEEIDVLATPSYTFSATQSDFAARFRLMFGFNAVEENCENGFAFMSNGNLIINNIEGEATMQIVDVAGRVISTETVNGSYNKALNLKAGVYVIKLNEMTQKVVVK